MRWMAIDLGAKRTGIAVGDDETRIVTPVDVITTASAAERDRQLAQLIDDHAPHALLLGLPLNMDGSEGKPAKQVRAIGDALHAQFQLPVHYMDERLTSAAADAQMSRSGLTRQQKKDRRDALAAATILRDFFAKGD